MTISHSAYQDLVKENEELKELIAATSADIIACQTKLLAQEEIVKAATQWRLQRFEGNTAPGAKERVWILRLGEAEENLAKALGKWTEPPKYNPNYPAALASPQEPQA